VQVQRLFEIVGTGTPASGAACGVGNSRCGFLWNQCAIHFWLSSGQELHDTEVCSLRTSRCLEKVFVGDV
jgi:hypothetical protein